MAYNILLFLSLIKNSIIYIFLFKYIKSQKINNITNDSAVGFFFNILWKLFFILCILETHSKILFFLKKNHGFIR